jgi:hypothetical protein
VMCPVLQKNEKRGNMYTVDLFIQLPFCIYPMYAIIHLILSRSMSFKKTVTYNNNNNPYDDTLKELACLFLFYYVRKCNTRKCLHVI